MTLVFRGMGEVDAPKATLRSRTRPLRSIYDNTSQDFGSTQDIMTTPASCELAAGSEERDAYTLNWFDRHGRHELKIVGKMILIRPFDPPITDDGAIGERDSEERRSLKLINSLGLALAASSLGTLASTIFEVTFQAILRFYTNQVYSISHAEKGPIMKLGHQSFA